MSATEVLTLALVLVTIFYAWQNRRMVKEMAAARKVSVMPKLVLTWTMASPTFGFPTVKNVGPGAALDVEIEVAFQPLPGQESKRDVRAWTANTIAPGEEKQFLPPKTAGGGTMQTEDLANTFSSVDLSGRYTDVFGDAHEADDSLEDIARWREVTGEAITRWQDPDLPKRHAKELADQLSKKFKSALDAIASNTRP